MALKMKFNDSTYKVHIMETKTSKKHYSSVTKQEHIVDYKRKHWKEQF